MYGQSCPTVSETSQTFCNGLATVADLMPMSADWYDEAGDDTPLPADEVLQDGEDYFAGAPDCTGTRQSVTVTLTSPDAPDVQDDFFTPCSGGGPYTITDLKEAIDAPAAPAGYTLEIFSTEYGKDDMPIADGTELVSGTNYFAGYYDADGEGDEDACQSDRTPVRFETVEANAPAATSPQVVCEGTTVSELEAEGTNRWYRTATSNPALPDDFEVQDGATYYASQIVPVDGPPCESVERTPVTVEVIPADAGEDSTDNVLCVSDADSQLNNTTNARAYFISLLEDGVPTDGTFDMATIADIVADYNDGTKTGYFETTYTATFDAGCTDDVVLAVTVQEDPYAGEDTEETVCITDFESFLPLNPIFVPAAEEAIMAYIEGTDITPDGTFSPSIADLFDQINEDFNNNAFPQTYTVTYTVDNGGCMDSSTLTLNVQSANDAGEDASEQLCESDVDDRGIFDSEETLRAYYVDLLGAEDSDGTFSPDLSTLIANYNDGVSEPSEDFGVTYTVDSSSECEPSSANATLTVTAAIPAEAGTIANQEYCSNEEAVNLFTLLSGDANPDGAFSSDNADVADGTFDPMEEGAGSYTITYTVSPETACVSTTDTAEFTILVNQAPNAGPGGDYSFCQGEFEALAAAVAANPSGMGIELLNELDPTITPGGMFSDDDLATLLAQYAAVSEADAFPATFTTTYTVSNDDCTDAASYSITVTPNTQADAGGDQEVTFCTTDGEMDLSNYLGDGATMGGMFMSDDADVTDGMFDPSAEGAGTFEVTYTANGDDDPCVEGESTATITITVVEGVDAGDDVTMVICENDLADDFFTEANLSDYYMGLLGDDVPTTGDFDPSIAELVDMYEGGMMTGDFTTTYTVGDGTCEDSVELTVTIRENFNTEDLEEVDDVTLCQNAGMQDLTSFLGDNPTFGSFDGYEDGMFDPGMMGPGTYEITYTLSEDTDSCVTGTASVSFRITVQDSAYAGEGMSATYCNNGSARDLFGMLTDGADEDGTFTVDGMTVEDGIFDPMDYEPGTYTVTYTVDAENDCGADTATFTFTINAAPNAGENFSYSVCQNAANLNLMSILPEGVSAGGSFQYDDNPIAGNTIDPSDFEPGEYAIAYVLSNGNCSDLSVLTLIIQDAANAGEDMDLSVCMNAGVQNLFDFLSADADTTGEFTLNGEAIADGMMDPMDFAAGTYEVTYTVEAINDCGDDTATFNITVQEAADAPTATDLTFCASEMPTGADLTATGDNLMFYSDAEMNTMVMAEDALMTGTYYVTQRTNDEGCESDAASFEVVVNDGATPTIDNPAVSFCEYDDATVLDLTDAIDQTDNITWYDAATGGEMLSTGTALQDGVIYYASYTDPDSGCESAVRLAVTVSIESCPLVFPEGISPNGDGMNDTFTIENIDREYPNYTIEIYNRWGDVVYKGNASTPDWDGTNTQSGSLGDDVLPVGVYFYLLEFNDGATAPRRGKIYLSR
ncbi:MAG: gliding motility-associated C-terminal domain-containing protein [Christiangramia sp.]